jgi:hypothetical protein
MKKLLQSKAFALATSLAAQLMLAWANRKTVAKD